MVKKLYLSIEFLFLFAALPMLYCFDVIRFPMIPTLAIVTGFCVVIHLQQGAPMNWRFSPIPRNLGAMLAIEDGERTGKGTQYGFPVRQFCGFPVGQFDGRTLGDKDWKILVLAIF